MVYAVVASCCAIAWHVIAAWVSYWHMVRVSLDAGEALLAAHLLPLSVDGLVVVASICLVEITGSLNRTTRLAGTRPTSRAVVQGDTTEHPTRAVVPSANGRTRPVQAVGDAGGARTSVGERVRHLAGEHPTWAQADLAEAARRT